MSRARKMKRLGLPIVAGRAPERSCDGCSACCTLNQVGELGKPAFKQCEHQQVSEDGAEVRHGCGIYAERPEECRRYYCAWQAGLIASRDHRPDWIGVMFDFRMSYNGTDVVTAWEVWPGAFKHPATRQLIDAVAKQVTMPVVLRRYGDAGGTLFRHNPQRFAAEDRLNDVIAQAKEFIDGLDRKVTTRP